MQFGPFLPTRYIYIYRTEINPGKNSDTRMKPLPLANGHGRFMALAVAPERALVSVTE
jgi:hypothetical protein